MAYHGKSSTNGVDPVAFWGFNQQQWWVSWGYNGNIRGVSLTSEISDIKMRRFVVLKNVYNGI